MRITNAWLVGFCDGEGCFYVGINANKSMSLGFQVLPEFRIVQHKRDVQLLYAIKRFFGCGSVTFNKNRNNSIMEYRVRNIDHLFNIIIPFFNNNKLLTVKKFDYFDFCEVVELIIKKEHLNLVGLSRIREIKLRMNRQRLKNIDKDKVQT